MMKLVDPPNPMNLWAQYLKKVPFEIPHTEYNLIKKYFLYSNAQEYSEYKKSKGAINTALLLVPFLSNLHDAQIFIVIQNPSVHPDNFTVDFQNQDKFILEKTVYQDFDNSEYPLLYLDPQYEGNPGYIYWRSFFSSFV